MRRDRDLRDVRQRLLSVECRGHDGELLPHRDQR